MTLTPDHLHILTINAKGLNKPEKRSGALRDFHKQRASIVMIQETHLKKGTSPKLTNQHYTQGYYSDYQGGKARGTAIILHRWVPFQEGGCKTDDEGRYLFLKGKIADHQYTFANIYAPNKQHYRFLKQTLCKLQEFAEGTLILGGDFNITLDPSWDNSSGISHVPTQQLQTIKSLLRSRRLVDCWRAHHPDLRNYTFYSHPHNSYS
ncbi:Hypothetical predicted protein [Pelobates cultripes]|uniref:exodeoxyribonuclease III n=1 Tax=Pelobates cultripes TaxID=61616 RepID=A0AAD1TDY9_PELCU|nr:Hypothetical predicted protein [Pelobates cultripes]